MVPVTDPYEWVGRVIRDFAVPRAGYTPDKTNIDPQDISDDPGFMDVEACLSHQNQAPEPSVSMGSSLAPLTRIVCPVRTSKRLRFES